MSIEATREFYRKEHARLLALPPDLECCACGHTLNEHEGARDVPTIEDWYSSTPPQQCESCSCTFFEEPKVAPVKQMAKPRRTYMSRTKNVPYVKLTQDDWKDIKETATNISGYDPEQSNIKGKTTVELMGMIRGYLTDAMAAAANGDATVATEQMAEAYKLATALKNRETYNRVVGEEKRNKMAAAASA